MCNVRVQILVTAYLLGPSFSLFHNRAKRACPGSYNTCTTRLLDLVHVRTSTCLAALPMCIHSPA